MQNLFFKTAMVFTLAVLSSLNSVYAEQKDQCQLAVENLKNTYANSNIEATVINSDHTEMTPYALVHFSKNNISYSPWKSLNNEVACYALRQDKGLDFNQNQGFVGPLVWHQSLIWDKLFSKKTYLKGYDCNILGRTRLAGRKVTVLRLSPVDELRYSYIVSKDDDTNLPVELAVLSPNQSVATKFTTTAVHSTASLQLTFPDETFDRVDKLSVKKTENKLTSWPELTIPGNFSMEYEGKQEQAEGVILDYQSFTDGLVEFRVYKNSVTTISVTSATDGTLSVLRKKNNKNEYAVVGEIPLELSNLILSKIAEN